ncbi:MAG: flagellar biosynthetic protein FliO [Serpentinimonas sp.]|jgi:flagellar protein FliO/FliZ|nr:flagellar biosynthetic protein FliO [Serpentinimonas sp.]
MSDSGVSMVSLGPIFGLLALLVLLAWGIQWARKRVAPTGSGEGAELRLVNHLAVGPQQRVAVVEVNGPNGSVQLTLGVTAHSINLLHTQALTPPNQPPAP